MVLRPATTFERRTLERLARPSLAWTVVGVVYFATSLVLCLLGILYFATRARSPVQSLFVFLVGVLGIAGFLYLRHRLAPYGAAERATARADLRAGEVDETAFAIVDAVEVAQGEDEGRHFFLRLGNGRVLFLSGQYLEQPVAAKRFPASSVTIVRAAASGVVLSMRAEGHYLAPSAVRPPFTEADYEGGLVPEDGSILDLDFEQLRGN
jgi:hypothetical protein